MFVTVSGFNGIRDTLQLPEHLTKTMVKEEDSLTFVLGRWFQPHESVFEQDGLHRPICPGPLRINHCLWRFAVTPNFRRILVEVDGSKSEAFLTQQTIFGNSQTAQIECYHKEKRAYYGLMCPHDIVRTCNMTPVFKYNTADVDDSVWLETVTTV